MVYLDDILVRGETWKDHLRHLWIALERLKQHKLYGKLSKCTFAVTEVEYFGLILKEGGVSMTISKVEAIAVWERRYPIILRSDDS